MYSQGRPGSRCGAQCPQPDRVRIPGLSQGHTSVEPTAGQTHDSASGRRTSGSFSLVQTSSAEVSAGSGRSAVPPPCSQSAAPLCSSWAPPISPDTGPGPCGPFAATFVSTTLSELSPSARGSSLTLNLKACGAKDTGLTLSPLNAPGATARTTEHCGCHRCAWGKVQGAGVSRKDAAVRPAPMPARRTGLPAAP